MGDTSADGVDAAGEVTAFERGKRVAERIVDDLAVAAGTQEVALGRFSRFAVPEAAGRRFRRSSPGCHAARRCRRIREVIADLPLSATAAGPAQPPAAAAATAGVGAGANRVVWIVSDFPGPRLAGG